MSLAAAALDLLHRKPGRKRKSTIRMSGDRSPRETVESIQRVAVTYRIRMGAAPEKALDHRYSTTLGQLYLDGSIDGRQYYVGERYRGCVISYWTLLGIPNPHPRSADLLLGSRGQSIRPDVDEDLANDIKGRFRDCRRALLDAGRELLVGSRINQIVYAVVMENWPRADIGTDDVQNLRCGLNSLARLLQIR